jgi:hypothetical protein
MNQNTTADTKKRRSAVRKLFFLLALLPILSLAFVARAQYQQPPYGQPYGQAPYGQPPPYSAPYAQPPQQYPLMNEVADKFVQRYRQSSCDQLWQKREEPRSQREMEAVQALRNDPQMRAAFINRVAAPVANKMFECGMIP